MLTPGDDHARPTADVGRVSAVPLRKTPSLAAPPAETGRDGRAGQPTDIRRDLAAAATANEHTDQVARVRAAELLAPTTSERHGTYAQRLGRGYDPIQGQRLLNERIHGRQVPGTRRVA